MRDVPFVDAHVHFWDLAHLHYDWLTPPFSDDGINGDVSSIASDYGPDEYRRDMEGWTLAGCVHVEAGAPPEQTLAETAWLTALGDKYRLPTCLVAYADLSAPDIDQQLEKIKKHDRVRGIRQIVNYHVDPQRTYQPRDLTKDTNWQAGLGRVAAHNLSFDLQAYPSQFPGLADILAAYPDMPVIVNHGGMMFHDEVSLWREGMRALAALPQCSVKLSGFGIVDHHWTEKSIRSQVLELVDMFGPHRMLAATDSPTDKLHATIDDCLHAYASILEELPADDRAAIWGRNANRIYQMGLGL